MDKNKKIKAIVINHGHLDIEWYKTIDAYRFWVAKIIDKLYYEGKKKKNYTAYTFDGSVFLLDDLVSYMPEYKKKIISLVKKGKLIIGPFYTQFDEWIPSGESIAMNCLWGDRKSKEYFAQPMKVGYVPDNFGHPSQFPQILKNFGIDNLLFMRGMIDIPKGREFYFEGQDGEKLIAVNYNYATNFLFANNSPENNNPRPIPYFDCINVSEEKLEQFSIHNENSTLAKEIIKSVNDNKDNFSQNVVCIPMGCDHCPPQIGLGDTVKVANSIQNDIDFVFGKPDDYISELKKHEIKYSFKGELIGCKTECILLGVLMDRIYQKIDHFACETLLFKYLLPLQAITKKYTGKDVYKELVNEIVKNILVNSTHDSIHGSCVDAVHKEIDSRNIFIKQTASEVILQSLNTLNKSMGKWWKDDERPIICYNPTSYTGYQCISAWFPIGDNNIIIHDKYGRHFDCFVHERESVVKNIQENPYYTDFPTADFRQVDFLCKMDEFSVETFAWKVVDSKKFVVQTNAKRIENEYFIVKENNGLIEIADKISGKKIFRLNRIKDCSDAGDAWDFSEPYIDYPSIFSDKGKIKSVKVQKMPFIQSLIIEGSYQVPYELNGDYQSEKKVDIDYKFEIVLTKGVKRVDVKLDFDNKAKDHMSELEIPLNFKADYVLANGSFGINKREIVPYAPHKGWVCMPTEYYPFNEWISVNDGKQGFTFAAKGLCGYKVSNVNGKTVLSIPINRSIGIMNKTFMKRRRCAPGSGWKIDDAQCLKKTQIEFSYIPFDIVKGNEINFIDDVNNFIAPAASLVAYKSLKYDKERDFKIVPFKNCNKNIKVSLFKKSYDEKYDVIRLYEERGRSDRVNLTLDKYSEVYISNLNEEKIQKLSLNKGKISLNIKHNKIITLLCR